MFCYSCTINDFGVEIFYGIIIVRGELMFVGFVGNPCSGIYIPTNVNADSFLYLLTKKTCYRQNYVPTNQGIIGYPVAATYQH